MLSLWGDYWLARYTCVKLQQDEPKSLRWLKVRIVKKQTSIRRWSWIFRLEITSRSNTRTNTTQTQRHPPTYINRSVRTHKITYAHIHTYAHINRHTKTYTLYHDHDDAEAFQLWQKFSQKTWPFLKAWSFAAAAHRARVEASQHVVHWNF